MKISPAIWLGALEQSTEVLGIPLQTEVAVGASKLTSAKFAPGKVLARISSPQSLSIEALLDSVIGAAKGIIVTKSSQEAVLPKLSVTVIVTILTPASSAVKEVGEMLISVSSAPQAA